MSAIRYAALVGRFGDGGGRYVLPAQWKEMKLAAWRMAQLNQGPVQVWSALPNGDLLKYAGEDTRRVSDHIVKARAALAPKAVA